MQSWHLKGANSWQPQQRKMLCVTKQSLQWASRCFPPSQFSILVKVSTKMRKIKKQKSKDDDLLVVRKTWNISKEKKMLEKDVNTAFAHGKEGACSSWTHSPRGAGSRSPVLLLPLTPLKPGSELTRRGEDSYSILNIAWSSFLWFLISTTWEIGNSLWLLRPRHRLPETEAHSDV